MRRQSGSKRGKTSSKGPDSVIRVIRRSDCAHIRPLILENTETGETEEVPDYVGIANFYAEAVATKWHPTNDLLVLAAERYLNMLDMATEPGNTFYFSPDHVVDYCRFSENLKHFEAGSWQFSQIDEDGNADPRIVMEPWQIWVEAAIQGFRVKRTGERLVSTALEIVPRKNAKSLKACAAILYDLTCGGMAPEIPIAAASEKQAEDTVFGDVLKMIANDPELVEHFSLEVTRKEVKCGSGRVFMLTSMGERQDGLNPSLALFEEGHGGAASVYRVIDSAFGARPNALKRMISTAGYSLSGPAWDLIGEAKMVLNGKYEDFTFFAAIYTLDERDYINPKTKAIDYDRLFSDEDLIYKANPMMEVSLDPVKIRAALLGARTPSKKKEMARTRFNIWAGAGTSLIEPGAWGSCERDIDLSDFYGQKCWIGVDLAQVKDMCAITLLFEKKTGEIVVFAFFYLPELSDTVTHPDIEDYIAQWVESRHLILTPGAMADHDLVREDIEAFCESFDVQVIACDPHQAHNTSKKLWDANKPVMTYPNSDKTMTAPFDDIDGRIASQTIHHDGNPVLAWNVGNVHGDRRGNGLILPKKEKENSIRKIDGFVALCFANGVRLNPAIAKPAEDRPKEDIYAKRGLIGFDDIMSGN